jgi:uncharacterized protein (TIGR02466 family)
MKDNKTPHTLELFPTSIWFSPLASKTILKSTNRELLVEIDQLMESDQAGWKWSDQNYVGGYTSYSSQAQLHKTSSTFGALESRIDRHVDKFVRSLNWDLEGRKLGMTDCWVNVMPHAVAHSLHLHPQSHISGTYYVSLPIGSGSLKFEDPRMACFMNTPQKLKGTPKNQLPFYHLEPEEGSLALWESWLRHEVAANRGDGYRVSVSFNYSIL